MNNNGRCYEKPRAFSSIFFPCVDIGAKCVLKALEVLQIYEVPLFITNYSISLLIHSQEVCENNNKERYCFIHL